MRRVAVLNSYNVPGLPGRDTRRIQCFLEALADRGFREGADFELQLHDSDEIPVIESAAAALVAEGVDLIHAVGTPCAVAAAEAAARSQPPVPVVYYGAHPEGIGDALCSEPHVTGQVQSLPFTSSYKRFRFLRRLIPRARVVWVPFFEGTVFVRPEMRELHAEHREQAGRPVWLEGGRETVGFASLAGLCYIIGVGYRELVYRSARELDKALREIDPADGVVMAYNETFYCPSAVEVALAVTAERRLPLIWNNNAHVAALGALAGIGADFEAAGHTAGEMAAAILSGMPPAEIDRRFIEEQVAWLNLDTAERLGLRPGAEVSSYFDRCIEGSGGLHGA